MACRVCRQSLPSVTQQARNLAAAVGKAVVAMVNGKPVLSYAQMKRTRVAICKQCPTNKYRADDSRCSACGCYVVAKASLATETCPDGHW